MKKDALKEDIRLSKARNELKLLRRKYRQAIDDLKAKDTVIESFKENDIETYKIRLKSTNSKGQATAFMVASDWHIDEKVRPSTVSGLNNFNEKIARKRAERFFQNGVVLLKMSQRDVEIKTLVLALLGDFISSNIHDELLENTTLRPVEAILFAQELIASGIEYILRHTDVNLVIPCSIGNHSRITKRIHISNETGNSLEYSLYYNLAKHFKVNKRVKFLIADGYHSYIKVYNKVIRLHHGHFLRYNGGVGGIYIPVNKAIAQWNKGKHADFDVFGHFHQFKDGGNFICNGSLIGWNAFAVNIKADFDKPKQGFFLFDKNRGKTLVAPIFID